ncbi:unnamed protein product [Moneuplotes crassus]|uniref:DNA-directed RNA polymerase II subunit RPB7 n=1 Tax=Euplotes crassus TaxID=5936 RepID=A0AAD1XP11_EUPCR|nr:unnamed protein product [Moneuplotes crassus]
MLEIDRLVRVAPHELHPDLGEVMFHKLRKMMIGTCTVDKGYCLDVISVGYIGDGTILDTFGEIEFPVKYTALLFKPFRGDVLDGTVTKVTPSNIIVTFGPQEIMITHSCMPAGCEYDPSTNVYKTPEMDLMIREEDEVRFRIIGVNFICAQLTCAGTMDEPYLGLINTKTDKA